MSRGWPWRSLGVGLTLLMCLPQGRLGASGSISGTVFQDFNGNGRRDLSASIPTAGGFGVAALAVDRGIAGVVVTATDSSGAVQGSTVTASDGSYVLAAAGTGPYRIEFSSLPGGFFPGPQGESNGTTVRFVPDGDSSGVDLGIVRPADHGPDNPELATNIYVFGDQISGPNADRVVLGSFPLNAGAAAGAPIPDPNPTPGSPDSGGGPYLEPQTHALAVPASQVGTTWGLAYNPYISRLYAAAFTKKFSGYGPSGTGAIYQTSTTGATATVFADLNAIFGAGTAGVDFRGTPTWTAQGGFYSDGFNTGWDAVGKTALGGLDISADGRWLYVVNLADRNLYILPTIGPLDATSVSRVTIPNPITLASSTDPNLDFRPFALTVHQGRVYVGAVNSAESTQNRANLRAFVLAFDPAAGTFAPDPVLQFDLVFPRGLGNAFSIPPAAGDWLPWTPVFRNLATAGVFDADTIYPQPWLTGLTFAPNGDLVFGFRDRTGDQVGVQTPDDPANPGILRRGIAVGDILRAAFDPGTGTFTLETNGSVGGSTSAGANNAQGPGGGEFYFQDYTPLPPGFPTPTIHDEMSVGGVLQVPGRPDVATTTTNPILAAGYFSRGGLRWFDNGTGTLNRAYEIYYSGPVSTAAITFSKANGIGDLASMPALAPVGIGNRVWRDVNRNGIQDPGEPPIANVTVRLYSDGGTLLATARTAADGTYYFSSGPGTSTNSAIYNVGAPVVAPTTLSVRLDNPADYTAGGPLFGLVSTIVIGIGPIDSNGVPATTMDVRAAVTVNGPGQNDHTIDFGFVEGADIEVQKVVDPAGPPGGRLYVQPGQPFPFWIKVFNHGPAAATGVVLRELLPPGLRLLSYVASQGTFDLATGVWMVGDMPAGGMALLDLLGVADTVGELENGVIREGSWPPDPNPLNDLSGATFIVSVQPDLEVTGVALPSLRATHVVHAGDPTGLVRFSVRNSSTLAVSAATLQGSLRASDGGPPMEILSAVASQGTIDLGAGQWHLGSLGPGGTATLDVALRATRQSRVTLELARTMSAPGDADASNDRAAITLLAVPPNASGRSVAVGRTMGLATGDLIIGSSDREAPTVRVLDVTGTEQLTFATGPANQRGGVRVASCDLDRDGRDEIVTAAGLPDGGPQVKVHMRRADGSVTTVAGWSPLGDAYAGGLYVACADLDGDRFPEIITGAGADGPAIVQLWAPMLSSGTARELGRGTLPGVAEGAGVRVAACDLTGDGRAEIVAAPAAAAAPEVRIFDVAAGRFLPSIAAARPGEANGLHVACGDLVVGGRNDVLVGLDGGGAPLIRAFSASGILLGEALAFAPAPGVGVNVAVGEFDGNASGGEFAVVSSHDIGAEVVVGTVQSAIPILLRLALPNLP